MGMFLIFMALILLGLTGFGALSYFMNRDRERALEGDRTGVDRLPNPH